MYVKLFNQILDSSIADDRRLRHFFTDLLLCSDAKGYVMMTEAAIARRIGATIDEVKWGIAELEKPDERSKTPENDGRRIERLDGVGYGWRILNYEQYRAMKDGDQMREATKLRVQRYRENKNHSKNVTPCNAYVTHGNAITEEEEEAEGEEEKKTIATPKDAKTKTAIEIYKLYPKKVGKDAAIKAIIKALSKVDVGDLVEAVASFANAKIGADPQYIPNPATWFNQCRWDDDRSTWIDKSNKAKTSYAVRHYGDTEQLEIPDA